MGGRIVMAREASGARPLVRLAPGTVLPRESVEQLRRLAELRAVAREAGRREGLMEVLGAAASALQVAGAARAEQLRLAEPQAMELAVRIAERILHTTLEREPERLARLVREVRASMPGERELRLRAGSAAHRLLESERVCASLEGVRLEEAPQEPAWSLVMEGAGGRLEFGLEAQLRAIASALGVG